MNIYPIKFIPILKEKVWGGDKLNRVLNKVPFSSNVGESWELSGVKGDVSVVSNGIYKSSTLLDLIGQFKELILGGKVYNKYGEKFPLLFKFIDASENLSLQLHPNDKLAKERHDSFGKTEMWYVLDADKQAHLYAGFNKKIDKQAYLDLQNHDLLDYIYKDKVKEGDAFFIKSGTIHAIGKGVLLAEIQQTSDVTYRLYDWGRLGFNGKPRELHLMEALDAIDFSKVGSCKLSYLNRENFVNEVFRGEFFITNKLLVKNKLKRDLLNIDSFIVYMCVLGSGALIVNGNSENITKGETVLIPAKSEQVIIETKKEINLLEIYL